jgi:hypothetical protein
MRKIWKFCILGLLVTNLFFTTSCDDDDDDKSQKNERTYTLSLIKMRERIHSAHLQIRV